MSREELTGARFSRKFTNVMSEATVECMMFALRAGMVAGC